MRNNPIVVWNWPSIQFQTKPTTGSDRFERDWDFSVPWTIVLIFVFFFFFFFFFENAKWDIILKKINLIFPLNSILVKIPKGVEKIQSLQSSGKTLKSLQIILQRREKLQQTRYDYCLTYLNNLTVEA